MLYDDVNIDLKYFAATQIKMVTRETKKKCVYNWSINKKKENVENSAFECVQRTSTTTKEKKKKNISWRILCKSTIAAERLNGEKAHFFFFFTLHAM